MVLPSEAAAEADQMVLPGLLNINWKSTNPQLIYPQMFQQAIVYLTMLYYILNLHYPDSLKFVFYFLWKIVQNRAFNYITRCA